MSPEITSNISTADVFSRVRYWKDFRAQAEHLFPTDSALRWFIRKHQKVLIDRGALLKLHRGDYIDPELFRAGAIELMGQSTDIGGKHVR